MKNDRSNRYLAALILSLSTLAGAQAGILDLLKGEAPHRPKLSSGSVSLAAPS